MMGLSSRRRTWMLFLAVTIGIVGLALSPPLLPPVGRAVVMHVFAPVCHQIPGRSPHLTGVSLAICDRCLGIYLGFLGGGVGVPFSWAWRRTLLRRSFLLLGGAGAVAGLDWIAPFAGLWANTPLTRSLTGALFGIVAGLVAGHGLLRSGPISEKGA
jgi:uncharacterized membrane protein